MKTPLRIFVWLLCLVLLSLSSGSCTTTTATAEITAPVAPDNAAKPPSEESAPSLSAGLEDLPFDVFLEESYLRLLQRDPELVTELGLDAAFNLPGDQLTDISDAYIRQTQHLESEILAQLQTYERTTLAPDQQLSYDTYFWYLDDRVRGHEFMYHDYPVTHFIIGQPFLLYHFFTEIQPVRNLAESHNYLARLAQVETKINQLIEGLRLRREAGIIAPKFLYQWSMGSVDDTARSMPELTVFYRNFAEKLDAISEISADEKQALLAQAEEVTRLQVIPAFKDLSAYLSELQSVAPTDDGVWQHPNGEAYYAYTVRHHTTTELTPDEIHQLGLSDLERIHAEMRTIFGELDYPSDESLPQLYRRIAQNGGTLTGSEIVAKYEEIIEQAKTTVAPVFDMQPSADVIVIPGPTGGYYVSPAVDGSRPGAFYAAVGGSEEYFGMPTLAYHEAVPGHHTQVALALELDLPSFRRGSHFTAYVEGWALYAERLMWELGVYEDDPYGDLGRLQYEAFRAARLVVDTGIHAKQWTFDKAAAFMTENTGLDAGMVNFEISRYIAWPGQALAYKIGMSEILKLRQMTEEQLGQQYDLKDFHNLVLSNGAVPLDILQELVYEYIESK
ncbi:MAG: DUF885 domain-containing protein [Chloroflexi bacterium]|jgi:uncharacterized protein (DUF885 family)|nr:DUF885 domain-containing protein [Chloroflexota bacterium]